MKQIQLINDDYKEHYEHIRHACRGMLVKDGKLLLSYETKNDIYLIPGGGVEDGESYAECCEREMLEETGMIVKAVRCYLVIEELFDVWKHINHYYICELVGENGEKHLTEAEERAGCIAAWMPIGEAKKMFGEYERFHDTDIADYGLYRREYMAVSEFCEEYGKL